MAVMLALSGLSVSIFINFIKVSLSVNGVKVDLQTYWECMIHELEIKH
uniref:Uncharacterized protein n=1 Tax=Strigamia maritima TaxID=126957 RepID=T1J4H4_STRMM